MSQKRRSAAALQTGPCLEIVPLTGYEGRLSYLPPVGMERLEPGQLVRVPLGRRTCLGVVSACLEAPPAGFQLKHVREVLTDLPILREDGLRLAEWLASYYAVGLDSVLEAMIPSAIRRNIRPRPRLAYRIASKPPSEEELTALRKRAPRQAQVYDFLAGQLKPMPRAFLLKRLELTASVLDGLKQRGLIEEVAQVDGEAAESVAVQAQAVELNAEQRQAADSLRKSLQAGKFVTHLLHGVTGSGKTEVYIDAMKEALAGEGSVIFLVPEVALTPQTVERLSRRLEPLGIKPVLWHSQLSDGERYEAWMKLASGEARVVVGARSAVFAPLKNLRLIVVDEEHEPSYKQAESPRYHGRDVAVYRAWLNGAVCVLGSATPSLESLYNARSGRYQLDRLLKRVVDRSMPDMQIVDMRGEILRARGFTSLSRALVDGLHDRFEKREQSILFLNRRGYSNAMICGDCGYVAMSPETSATLKYHRTDETLRCHLTGYIERAATQCPECGSSRIRWRGTGTQRVEEALAKVVPAAKVVRVDADSTSRKHALADILSDFRKGKIDILLGTQMIAKGLDFPNVTLVGLIDADLSLHLPDFRAAERTFQLLVQVSGRAGRGDRAGEVIVQTFLPHSAPIQFAKREDFDGFLEAELEQREEFRYPPYRHLIRHLFRGRNPEKLEFYTEQWARKVEEELGDRLEIRGPAPAPLERLQGEYRFHLWYFCERVQAVIGPLQNLRTQFPFDKEVRETLDVDPVDLI